jgi:hypothetical protein
VPLYVIVLGPLLVTIAYIVSDGFMEKSAETLVPYVQVAGPLPVDAST